MVTWDFVFSVRFVQTSHIIRGIGKVTQNFPNDEIFFDEIDAK